LAFSDDWIARRSDQPFKAQLLPLIKRFERHLTDDMTHIDDLSGPVSDRVVWSEGNPIPHWFMVNRGGLHVSHFSAIPPWADIDIDSDVIRRVPHCPQKWKPEGISKYPGRPGFTLVLGDENWGPGSVNRRHPSDASTLYSLDSQIDGAKFIRICNPYSGLILSAAMSGKPFSAPLGGLFGPLVGDPSYDNVLRCLTWLEKFSVDVLDPCFADKLDERLAA